MNKIENILNFYSLATELKYKIRSGWNNKHWNVTSERVESIAEHVYGTCILAIAVHSEFGEEIDLNKVLKMLAIHEIGEVIIGDITPYDKITPEEKIIIEHKAIKEVLGDLTNKDELYNLLVEFDEHKTKESIFAYYCDKLEADLQSKYYQDNGYHRSLDDQEGNQAMNSERVKNAISNGASTPFDVWYEVDKGIYKDEVFSKILEYVKKK